MAFTYTAALLTDLDPIIAERAALRLALGDTDEGHGPRANGKNFADEELDFYLNEVGPAGETDLRVETATYWLCDMLARDWSKVASLSIGPRSQSFGAVAKEWADRAKVLSVRFGFQTAGVVFSVAPNRVDGYSENASGEEYAR